MSISYDIETSSELLEKIKRDQKRISNAIEKLDNLEIKDSIYDFCNTAYSLKDWKKEDWKKEGSADEKLLNNFLNQYFANENVLTVCQLICTANKHQNANQTEQKVSVRVTDYTSQNPHVSSSAILASSSMPVTAKTIYISVNDVNVADAERKYEIIYFAQQVVDLLEKLMKIDSPST